MPPSPKFNPLETQRDRNRQTRGLWDGYRRHRENVTHQLIQSAGRSRASLCVLGAGNANDLNLDQLLDHFESVTLVDWDREALDQVLVRMDSPAAERLQCVGDLDLTGILETLHDGNLQSPPSLDELAQHARQVQTPSALTQYDVVASTCLLTQLVGAVLDHFSGGDPLADQLALAVRDGHLHLMDQLMQPGGSGVLITDVVSSDTLPELLTMDQDAGASGNSLLDTVLLRAIEAGNFFTGTNPVALFQHLTNRFTRPHIAPSWIWSMGNRRYAVCALTMEKLATEG